jgi:hypothetical protein
MSSLDATDLNSLPVNPSAGNASSLPANIVITKEDKIPEGAMERLMQEREKDLKNSMQGPASQQAQGPQIPSQQMPNAMEQSTLNNFISGIQQASASGLTSLPSRDIPQMTSAIALDNQVKPNYIPQQQGGYIENKINPDYIINEQRRQQNKMDTLDVMYDELQIPILLAILFFLFQLPVFRSYLLRFAPSLFNKDGNPNLSGYVINSMLFALLYYVIKNSLNYLTTI